MTEALSLRNDAAPTGLVVVRLGARTMQDDLLMRSVEQCHERWGIWGFSVFEVPDGDYDQLARLRPIVAERRQLLVAEAADLVEDGFPFPQRSIPRTGPSFLRRRPLPNSVE